MDFIESTNFSDLIKDANRELIQRVAELTEPFQVCPFDGVINRAPTGEYYESLTSSGYKKEGEDFKDHFNWPRLAVDAFLEKFFEILMYSTSDHVLYWRSRPKIIMTDYGFVVFSRLLFSDSDIDVSVIKGKRLKSEPYHICGF